MDFCFLRTTKQELLTQLEFEKSYKSDFELREEREVTVAKLLKDGKIRVDLDAVAQQTAVDLKDSWKTERSKFQPASRITEADKLNDLKSTERKLEHSLTLIKEQQIGKDKLFLLPQGKLLSGETLYDAAQRVIVELCGSGIQATMYGKAPCGFYKYKYPKANRGENVGAKVFFYRAILKSGQVDETLGQFQWLDKTELFEKVNQYSNYKKSISKFII